MSTENFILTEHVFDGCHIREYPGCTVDQEDVLKLHVNQYTPRNQTQPIPSDAITFVFAHGASVPKEIYEPMWDELLALADGFTIRGIWVADCASMSASGITNEDKLSMDHSWMDYARDILMMINQFRDKMPRPLVGLGHSMGGTIITHVAYLHPRLFTGLMLLDPVLQIAPPRVGVAGLPKGPVNYGVWRDDVWPNREAAMRGSRGLVNGWDPRCIERMARHGFRDLPTKLYPDVEAVKMKLGAKDSDVPVTLATTKHQEVLGMLREKFSTYTQTMGEVEVPRDTHPEMNPMHGYLPLYRPEVNDAYKRLPTLRPSCLWVLGGDTYLNLEEMREGIRVCGKGIGGSGGRVKEVTVPGLTHLMTFQAVKATMEPCAAWLKEEMIRFGEDERKWKKKQTERGHTKLEDDWYKYIPPMDKKQPPKLQGKL